MNNKVKWLISRNDLNINLETFKNENNILFITGLVGSGKSTLARELGKKYNATVIIQDFLAWSDCYDSDECKFFVTLFIEIYPETKEYFKNNTWRKATLSNELKDDYRKKFDKMVIEYAINNKNEIFIYEGSDLFCKSDFNLFLNKPLIIKRTSAIKSFIRNFKRGNKDNNTLKKKITYLKRMKWEFKRFYIEDLPRLNDFIINITNKE